MKSEKLLENQRKRQQQIMFEYHMYNDENPFGWNGEIDCIVYKKFYAEGKESNGILWEELGCSEMEFNAQGKVSQIVEYRKKELFYKHLKEYDDEGRLIIERSYDAQGENTTNTRFKYDKCGDLKEEVILHAQAPTTRYLYTYDRQGRLIQIYELNKYDHWVTYLYNEDDNIAMRADIYPDGSFGIIETYSYDKNGNIEHSLFKESFESFTYYEYDLDGKVTKKVTESHGIETDSEESSNESTQIWYEEFEYDEKGNVISLIEREGCEIVYRHEWIIKYKER